MTKGSKTISWECICCHRVTTKTLKELDYDYRPRRFCSIGCVYKFGSRTGMKTSKKTKSKLRKQKLGDKNPSWRGGVTPNRVSLRNTPEYKIWRKLVYERDNYTCQSCKQRGGKLEADHITPYMIDNSRLLDVSNGQTLCKQCHKLKTIAEMKQNWSNQYSKNNKLNERSLS